jgi:prepilin-type N-terminal cleavage/methylation domain-containing protein
MHHNLRERARSEGGFTLIELLVVMIIIAILMAVAVPTFLSQKNNALKTKATGNIKQIITAMETCAVPITGGGYRQNADATTGDVAIDCSNITTLRNTEKALTSLKLGPAALDTYAVTLSPTFQGMKVETAIREGSRTIYFSEVHDSDGRVSKRCGLATTRVPSDANPSPAIPVTPIADSKTCQAGKW